MHYRTISAIKNLVFQSTVGRLIAYAARNGILCNLLRVRRWNGRCAHLFVLITLRFEGLLGHDQIFEVAIYYYPQLLPFRISNVECRLRLQHGPHLFSSNHPRLSLLDTPSNCSRSFSSLFPSSPNVKGTQHLSSPSSPLSSVTNRLDVSSPPSMAGRSQVMP
jgi:hypothetical protein